MKPTPLLLEECFVNSKIAATPDAGIPLSEACQLDPDQPEAYDFSAMLATLNVLTFIPSSPQNGFLWMPSIMKFGFTYRSSSVEKMHQILLESYP